MSAQEKFKSLGFDLKEYNDVSIVYEHSPEDTADNYKDIIFNLKYNQIEILQDFDTVVLDAVVEQCKELGWL